MVTKTKTLDGILAGFRKTVDDLNVFAQAKRDEAMDLGRKAAEIEADADAAWRDSGCAAEVSKKISALIEG